MIFFSCSSKSFEDDDSFIESDLEEPNIGKQNKKCRSKSNNKQKTRGKPRWSQVVLDDFIDMNEGMNDIYPGSSTHPKVVFREVLHPIELE